MAHTAIHTVDELKAYLNENDFREPQMERVIIFLIDEIDGQLLRQAAQSILDNLRKILQSTSMSPGGQAAAEGMDRALRGGNAADIAAIVHDEFYLQPRIKRFFKQLRDNPTPEQRAVMDRATEALAHYMATPPTSPS